MKFTSSALLALASAACSLGLSFAEESCTHGKLYMSDTSGTTVHIFDLGGSLENLVEENTVTVAGGPELHLSTTASGKYVSSLYRGTKANFYSESVVNWIDTGLTVDDHGDHVDVSFAPPSLVDNAAFECTRPIHYVLHDEKIAIFCDGSFDAVPQVNTTVWVLDESKFGSATESAIVFTTALEGTHHGVAIPVDDNHVLYSLPTPDRVNRVEDASSLPATFQVVDYQGNILESIADTTNDDKSCSGFHGSSAQDNTFVLACDQEHGGVLVVDYNDASNAYASRELSYPATFPQHRTGSFAEHHKSPYVVGNFASSDAWHLMAFSDEATQLSNSNVLTLESQQCAFAFEKAEGNIVLVLMPNGMLHAYELETGPSWVEVAKIQAVKGMTKCDEAKFVPGFVHSFIMQPDTKTLHAIDLSEVHEGTIDIKTTTLGFTPFSAVVAGAPAEGACTFEEHDHDHDDDKKSAASKYALANAAIALGVGSLFL